MNQQAALVSCRAVAGDDSGGRHPHSAIRVAYADPPYPGQAARHYSGRPDYGGEVDHVALIRQLEAEYPNGWALSSSSVALRDLLPLCPAGVRVGAWVKPFCSFKPGVPVAYAWEPVIWTGGRRKGRDEDTVRDWVAASITLRRGCHGAKPLAFAFWLFSLLGLRAGDTLADLFPGSGAITEAWQQYQRSFWGCGPAENEPPIHG